MTTQAEQLNAFEALVDGIVVAFEAAYTAMVGREYIYFEVAESAKLQRGIHEVVLGVPWKLAELVAGLSRQSQGILGAAKTPRWEGAVIHVSRLHGDWETRSNGTILAALVINVSVIWEEFLEQFKGDQSVDDFLTTVCPESAGHFREFWEGRNCIVHRRGRADRRYLDRAADLARVRTEGEPIPLDWEYVEDRLSRMVSCARTIAEVSAA